MIGNGVSDKHKTTNAKDKLGFVIYSHNLPSGFTLSNDKCVQRVSYIYVPADTTISYPGALIEDLYIHVGYLTEDGNIDILKSSVRCVT